MNWLKNSFKGLNTFEKNWLWIFSAIIVASTLYFSATTPTKDIWGWLLNWVLSPVSALTGVICVVLCAKGKIQNYWWGIINALTYGVVAWTAGYLGDAFLNIFFFLPSQIFIFFFWKKHLDGNSVVAMKRMKPWVTAVVVVVSLLGVYFFAQFLMGVDNFFTQAMRRSSAFYANLTKVTGLPMLGPLLDSTTVILQVVAQILLILMFAEQWPLWIAVDIITVGIWGIVIATDPTSWGYAVPTLIMWVAFLANSLWGIKVWYKSSK